jgi:hypothetical protein
LKTYNFEAEMMKHEDMDAAYITFPYKVEEEFGTKGQVKVKVVFDESVEYRGSLAKMGLECHCLGIPQKTRVILRKGPGELVQVNLHKDEESRVVEIPDDLKIKLQQNQVEEAFSSLSYTRQKTIVESIVSSKKAETRTNRIKNVVHTLDQ